MVGAGNWLGVTIASVSFSSDQMTLMFCPLLGINSPATCAAVGIVWPLSGTLHVVRYTVYAAIVNETSVNGKRPASLKCASDLVWPRDDQVRRRASVKMCTKILHPLPPCLPTGQRASYRNELSRACARQGAGGAAGKVIWKEMQPKKQQ